LDESRLLGQSPIPWLAAPASPRPVAASPRHSSVSAAHRRDDFNPPVRQMTIRVNTHITHSLTQSARRPLSEGYGMVEAFVKGIQTRLRPGETAARCRHTVHRHGRLGYCSPAGIHSCSASPRRVSALTRVNSAVLVLRLRRTDHYQWGLQAVSLELSIDDCNKVGTKSLLGIWTLIGRPEG
jgi:hypothetical protein